LGISKGKNSLSSPLENDEIRSKRRGMAGENLARDPKMDE
jgi:hypothetical protein